MEGPNFCIQNFLETKNENFKLEGLKQILEQILETKHIIHN